MVLANPSHLLSKHRLGQTQIFIRIYGVHTVFLAGNYHTYGHIRCVYMVLANPSHNCPHTVVASPVANPVLFWSCGQPCSVLILWPTLFCSDPVANPVLFWSCGQPRSVLILWPALFCSDPVASPVLFWSCGQPYSVLILWPALFCSDPVASPVLFWPCGQPCSVLILWPALFCSDPVASTVLILAICVRTCWSPPCPCCSNGTLCSWGSSLWTWTSCQWSISAAAIRQRHARVYAYVCVCVVFICDLTRVHTVCCSWTRNCCLF